MTEEDKSKLEHILIFGKNRFFCGPIRKSVAELLPGYPVTTLYAYHRFEENYLDGKPHTNPCLIICQRVVKNSALIKKNEGELHNLPPFTLGIHKYAKNHDIKRISPTFFGFYISQILRYKLKRFKKSLEK